MGATVFGYWRGITREQYESQPGFYNDCKAWGEWMAERYEHPDVLDTLEELGLRALLSHTTYGMDEAEIDWVRPDDLVHVATRLRELVLAGDPRVARIVETYALSANEIDPVDAEFAQDLADVGMIARYAKEQGVNEMTLEVNW